jgi:hypothetical protein
MFLMFDCYRLKVTHAFWGQVNRTFESKGWIILENDDYIFILGGEFLREVRFNGVNPRKDEWDLTSFSIITDENRVAKKAYYDKENVSPLERFKRLVDEEYRNDLMAIPNVCEVSVEEDNGKCYIIIGVDGPRYTEVQSRAHNLLPMQMSYKLYITASNGEKVWITN